MRAPLPSAAWTSCCGSGCDTIDVASSLFLRAWPRFPGPDFRPHRLPDASLLFIASSMAEADVDPVCACKLDRRWGGGGGTPDPKSAASTGIRSSKPPLILTPPALDGFAYTLFSIASGDHGLVRLVAPFDGNPKRSGEYRLPLADDLLGFQLSFIQMSRLDAMELMSDSSSLSLSQPLFFRCDAVVSSAERGRWIMGGRLSK